MHTHTKCPSRHLKKTSQKHSLDIIIVLIDLVDATHDGTIEQENKKMPKEREETHPKQSHKNCRHCIMVGVKNILV